MTRATWAVVIAAMLLAGSLSFGAASVIGARRAAAAPGADGVGPGMAPVTQYLDLSNAQRDQVRPVNQSFQAQRQSTCLEMQEARTALMEALRADPTDRAAVDAALADVSRLQARQQRLAAEYILEIKPALTDDQRARLFDMVGQRFCGQGRCGAGLCPAAGGPGRQGRFGRNR